MVLRKGKVVDKLRLNITGTAIPTISEKPGKILGKVFDSSLRDTTSTKSSCTELDGWLTSAELWKAEPHHIKFLIQAVYDVLPSPSNLPTWGLAEPPACPVCSKRGTLEHILSCCTRALGDGRYRWRA